MRLSSFLLLLKRFKHPWMVMAFYIPLSGILIFVSHHYHPLSLSTMAVLTLIGFVGWTFVEYLLHRFIFHWAGSKQPWKDIASGLHIAHHEDTKVDYLILAPPYVGLAFSVLLYFIFALIFMSFAKAVFLVLGILIGYMVYEWVHFLDHLHVPRSWWGKALRRYHLQHHFRYPERRFGVTSPFWDWIFGTYSVADKTS